MKRLTAIFFALLLMFGAATTTSAASRDSKNNSRVEKFVQGLAHDYSSHVEYSYISMNMLRSLFSMMFGEDDKEMAKTMKRLKYIRKYRILFVYILPSRHHMTVGIPLLFLPHTVCCIPGQCSIFIISMVIHFSH